MPPRAHPAAYAAGTPITVDGRGAAARTGAGIAAGTVDHAGLSGRYRR